jgi:transcriptional regulator with XRE-family HTH domain
MLYSAHLLRHLRLTIGHNIHQLRATRKLPLAKLSRLSNIPPESLDHYELGKSEIRLDEMLRIACALDVPLDRIFDSPYPSPAFHETCRPISVASSVAG